MTMKLPGCILISIFSSSLMWQTVNRLSEKKKSHNPEFWSHSTINWVMDSDCRKKKKPHDHCFGFRHFLRSVSLEVEPHLRQCLKLGMIVICSAEIYTWVREDDLERTQTKQRHGFKGSAFTWPYREALEHKLHQSLSQLEEVGCLYHIHLQISSESRSWGVSLKYIQLGNSMILRGYLSEEIEDRSYLQEHQQ